MQERYGMSCHQCGNGIPFSAWYFRCLLCDSFFCNDCHDDHPSTHLKWFRRNRTRFVPRGAAPEQVDCAKCMKMVHCRIQCTQCELAYCAKCDDEDPIACWESHEHRKMEFVSPPEMEVNATSELCKACSSDGSTHHCYRCRQGIRVGEYATGCQTCETLYGLGMTCCSGCFPQVWKEHAPEHTWRFFAHVYNPSADDTFCELKCNECQQILDGSIPSQLRNHPHSTYVFSYGRPVHLDIMRKAWKGCWRKPCKELDLTNEELRSKTKATCWFCESGFLNSAKAYFCFSCLKFCCAPCYEKGPGKTHEHQCTEVTLICERPPDNLHNADQRPYQKQCASCQVTMNIWLSQSLSCLSCKEWYVCSSCIINKTLSHTCPKTALPSYLLDDTYPMEDKWWAQETVLLGKRIDTGNPPELFLKGTEGFEKIEDGDLTVRPGDRIAVSKPAFDHKVVKGKNYWTDRMGPFPISCTEVDSEAQQYAENVDWIASDDEPAKPAPAATPQFSTEAQLRHKDENLRFWGSAIRLGATLLGS